MKQTTVRKPWSLWFGIIPGVAIGYGLVVLLATTFALSDRFIVHGTMPLLFAGGLLGALAIHARNKAKGAAVVRHSKHWSPAQGALNGAGIGLVLYLLSFVLPGFPPDPFNMFVVGLTFWGAVIAWVHNLFVP
jgi:hypothetical protein